MNQNNLVVSRFIIRCVKMLDVILVSACFAFVWVRFYNPLIVMPYYRIGNYVIVGLFAMLFYYLVHLYSGFLINLYKVAQVIYSQLVALGMTVLITFIVICLLCLRVPTPVPMLICFLVQALVIICWTIAAHRWYFASFPKQKTIIIWDELKGVESLIKEHELDKEYQIIDSIPVAECDESYMNGRMLQADVVFLSCIHSHERNQIVKVCVREGIKVFVIPRIGDVIMSGALKMHLMHLPILQVSRYDPTPEYLILKRVFDIFVSGLSLIILSPLMVITALVIRADGGTAFYRQRRLTKDGKEFDVLKFRSMRMDAEKDGVARLSTGDNDDRITKVGHFIRACRIDELPQLINILKGEMSVVGPRPERPEIAESYMEELPEFSLRLQAKAGLTGYAQVYGKYNTTPYDKLLMDLMYIAKPSFAEDLKICFATVKILFMKDSTEGIAQGQTTAALVQDDEERSKE